MVCSVKVEPIELRVGWRHSALSRGGSDSEPVDRDRSEVLSREVRSWVQVEVLIAMLAYRVVIVFADKKRMQSPARP